MPATVTLGTTTLLQPASASNQYVCVLSAAGLTPGTRLWIDKELISVRLVGITSTGGTCVFVTRGVDGTSSAQHNGGATITIGRPDQFFNDDPVGRPSEVIPVSPRINVTNGKVWFAQGDTDPNGYSNRWWQEQTTTYDIGALGIRTLVQSPTSST